MREHGEKPKTRQQANHSTAAFFKPAGAQGQEVDRAFFGGGHSLGGPLPEVGVAGTLQAKRVVSEPGDAHEQEADRVAAQVMRMPDPLSPAERAPHRMSAHGETQDVQRFCTACEEKLQTRGDGAQPAAARGLARVESTLHQPGQSLDPAARAFFEPRFGMDLGDVRVHTDGDAALSAREVNARAYTVGRDIVFNSGEYSPHSDPGRLLLAHELTHVVQQSGAAGVSRKPVHALSDTGRTPAGHGTPATGGAPHLGLAVPAVVQESSPSVISRRIKCDPQASLSSYFIGKAVNDVTESDSVYAHTKGGAGTAEQEILIDMLASARIFHVDGDSDATTASNLDAHVKARLGIVTFASKKKYKFTSRAGWSMNPKYYDWDVDKATWKMKPGVDKQAAYDDLNDHPELYTIACAAATQLTMKGGSKAANLIDKPTSDTADWVPGDAGYVENASYNSTSGQIGIMGENIIYTGSGNFWGHLPGGATYRTLAEWITEVKSWTAGGGKATVDEKRECPDTGLL